jgi:hypothetical protein
MTDKKVIICGVIKNVEHVLQRNIEHALETGSKFNKFKLVIYENNSTDNTKDILHRYKSNENVKIISENIKDYNKKENNKIWAYTEITGSDHPCRIEHICNARNKLLEEINKQEYNEYTYVIVIDLDSNGWDINGILDSFNRTSEWDAIFANSSPNYYDYYALRMNSFPFGPEITGESFWNLPNYTFNHNDLIPVYSAFNGIGIYKKDLYTKYKYDFIVNDDIKKFYRNYLINHSISDNTMNIIKNKCNKFPYGYKDEMGTIFWKSNSGYDNTVVCEHVPLNFALFNDGYKLFINPNMVYVR